MSVEGTKFCDLCGESIAPQDIAPVKIERDGHVEQCHFHNRHHADCLAQEILRMESELVAA